MNSINEIKNELSGVKDADIDEFISKYLSDSRTGVQKLCSQALKRKKALEQEKERMYEMFSFERMYEDRGLIAGIDEVGRGPLAGPVVTCALILPKECDILYINDSKKLSAAKRDELYEILIKEAVEYSIGIEGPEVIDEINILQATLSAMRKSVLNLKSKPGILLCDAVHIPEIDIEQVSLIKGDARSASIAAASIVAKVVRDRMMEELDKEYPQYGFVSNKGYGSKEHIEALKKYGPCPIHRRSFIKNFN